MPESHPDRLYSIRHLWVSPNQDESTAEVGITEELMQVLNIIISIEPPMVGDELEMDTPCMQLHLSNGIRLLYAPLTGRVTELNKEVLDNPGLLAVAAQHTPLYTMEYDEAQELDLLLSPTRYAMYLDEYEIR